MTSSKNVDWSIYSKWLVFDIYTVFETWLDNLLAIRMNYFIPFVLTLLASPWLRPTQGETTAIPIGDCVGRDEELRNTVSTLARQMMLQQLFVEEKSRSDGDSGLKAVRLTIDGTRPYYANSYLSYSIASIHDHTDHKRTVGMGELLAVLNGVEFRTRHNDYSLSKPSTTSDKLHETEPIPFPDVPPEVSSKATVTEEILEMREWFKAWQEGSTAPRDYRKYFKPLMCYLEGAWTSSNGDELDEPFESDRHFINAKSWFDLQEKIRYTAYHGSKDNGENLAYLPTTIIAINETTGSPIFAQFNYRILCHPIARDISLDFFKPAGDLHARVARKSSFEDYQNLRSARFTLSQYTQDRFHRWDLLDEIMKEIPGADNYGADLRDNTFRLGTNDVFTGQPLNSGYYHRWYLVAQDGAMGTNIGHRGFNDRNMFIAENTRSGIAGIDYEYCLSTAEKEAGTCTMQSKKVTYAIPLEIVWLTPLHSWNPYDIQYKGSAYTDLGETVVEGGRNGGFTPSTAFNGANSNTYYRTPSAFFSDGEIDTDAADTLKAFTGVLDESGNVQNVTASGVRISLPAIPGINGNVRTRYPIMPIYGEGSTIWKELEALRTLVMDIQGKKDLFENDPGFGGDGGDNEDPDAFETTLWTSFSQHEHVGTHQHSMVFTNVESDVIRNGGSITVTTNVANNHAHVINYIYNATTDQIQMSTCDGRLPCWDGHTNILTLDEIFRAAQNLPQSLG